MPVTGAVVWRANDVAPSGFVLCNGQELSRTVFAALFAIIGTDYGAGNGSTTYNVPNLIDRHPLGKGGALALGNTGGASFHTHTGPSHTHSVTEPATHSLHSSDGAHTHDDHTGGLILANAVQVVNDLFTHSSDGGHTHNPHPAHTGSATGSDTGTTGGTDTPFATLRPLIKT